MSGGCCSTRSRRRCLCEQVASASLCILTGEYCYMYLWPWKLSDGYIGEGVYKQHTSTRVIRWGYLPQTGDRLGALSQRYPTGSGRSVRKPAIKPVGRRTIETYCVLPDQEGRRESHTLRRHTTVALRCEGPPPLIGGGSCRAAARLSGLSNPRLPRGTAAARRRRVRTISLPLESHI